MRVSSMPPATRAPSLVLIPRAAEGGRDLPRVVESLRRSDTFLGSWLRYMDHQETHSLFDLWSGLWALSNAVSSYVQVQGPAGSIPLNIYVLFVAESGLARKSTAVSRAVDLLRRTGLEAHWVTRGVSPHRLFKEATSSHLIFAASELVTLLGKSSVAYQLPGLLTDLYDGPVHGGWLTSSEGATLRAGYTTLLGAAAPSWLLGSINSDVLLGGFSSRLVVVRASAGKGLRPWPDHLVDDTQALRELNNVVRHHHNHLVAAPDCAGGGGPHQDGEQRTRHLTLDEDAVRSYRDLYMEQSRGDWRGTFLPSFYSRWSTHVLKTAGLLAVNRRGQDVNCSDLDQAAILVRTAGEHGDQVFARGRAGSERRVEDVKRVLVQRGTTLISLTELSRKLGSQGLKEILDAFHALDMVQVVEVKGPRGRPTLMYRATTRMLEVRIEDVVRAMNKR